MATSSNRGKRLPRHENKKLFVLDTNILLHDPYSLFRFKEHDVYISFVTVEELDGKKSGKDDVNRNARQATRLIEQVMSAHAGPGLPDDGFPLSAHAEGCEGRLILQTATVGPLEGAELARKNDNLYLAVLHHLVKSQSHEQVVMVTKDLNLRIKARAMGFACEDYLHDHVVDDADQVYSGTRHISEESFEAWSAQVQAAQDGNRTLYEVPRDRDSCVNEFVTTPDGGHYRVIGLQPERAQLARVPDYRQHKNNVWGMCARSDEQCAALNLLLDPEVDLVALLGPAGTGKTMMTVAAGLQQIMDEGLYDEMLFTRATVPLGDDIGFLPGSEEEKMAPWLGALWDNLDVLIEQQKESPAAQQRLRESSRELIEVKSITFMRGRTLHRKFVVVDEAQNLTPQQMRALTTRAGEGAKLVFLGNLAQIDTPYLSEASSGLSYLVERFKGWEHFGALALSKGQRSRLANEANQRL